MLGGRNMEAIINWCLFGY